MSCRAFLKIAPSIPDLPASQTPVHRESCGGAVRVLRRRVSSKLAQSSPSGAIILLCEASTTRRPFFERAEK